MRRLFLPILIAMLLLVLSGAALNRVTAAPDSQQATATQRSTATSRVSATVRASPTARTSPTPDAEASPTVEGTEVGEETPEPESTSTVEATESTTDTTELTATPAADDDDTASESDVITTTQAITGSILPPLFQQPGEVDTARTITVIGEGEITAAPDVAVITLGVETTGDDVSETTEENGEAVEALLEAIASLDIADENVQTSNYSVFVERPSTPPGPTSNQQDEEEQELIYHVTQQVTVRIEDLDENLDLLSDLIEAAVDAGANNVFGPNFSLSDDPALRQRAQRAAVEDALLRAQDWATLTGLEVVGVASVTEIVRSVPTLDGIQSSRGVAADSAMQVQPGSLTYREQVQIVFYVQNPAQEGAPIIDVP